MKVELNKFQLVYYIQGSVRSAHGRDEIWHRVIQEFIPHLASRELDFLWWISYRDFWNDYLLSCTGMPVFGAESYLQALAALNRNNHYLVTTCYRGKHETNQCYKFKGRYHVVGHEYNISIIEECITEVVHIKLPDEEPHMEDRFVKDWQDLSLYERTPEELLNTRKRFY